MFNMEEEKKVSTIRKVGRWFKEHGLVIGAVLFIALWICGGIYSHSIEETHKDQCRDACAPYQWSYSDIQGDKECICSMGAHIFIEVDLNES